MTVHCLAEEDTVRGFRLAGVPGTVVTDPASAGAALQRTLADPNIGILIVTESVGAQLRARIDAHRRERSRPLVVEIPGPEGPSPNRPDPGQWIQSAMGIGLEFGNEPDRGETHGNSPRSTPGKP